MKTFIRFSLLHFVTGMLFLANASHGVAASQTQPQKTTSASKKSASTAAPSAQEIADAKSKNLVWVNTNTRVYHNGSSSLYGSTKRGRFMAEEDAKKAGYRAASESTGGNKKASPATK